VNGNYKHPNDEVMSQPTSQIPTVVHITEEQGASAADVHVQDVEAISATFTVHHAQQKVSSSVVDFLLYKAVIKK